MSTKTKSGIAVDDLAWEVQKTVSDYSERMTKAAKEAVETVSAQAVKDLKETSPIRTGAYARDWKSDTAFNSARTRRNTVYNRKHYQLTHLLEHGHAKRGGGRTEALKHIEPVEQKSIQTLERLITEAATNGNET